MRKAKVAALIIGGVSTCIFGGIFGVYATAPIVSSVSPSNDVESIYEVENEELANAAAVTSIRTTAQTTTSNTPSPIFTTCTTTAVKETTVEAQKDQTISASFSGASARPSYMSDNPEAPTEAPTSSYTNAPVYDYTSPVDETQAPTEPWSQPETEVWNEPEPEVPEEPITEPVTDPPVEEPIVEVTEPVTEYVEAVTPIVPEEPSSSLSITDEEYIILCNAVAHEAGCNWISTYDKALVVEVIMNRVNSPLYPNSIVGVLTQPYQFSGSSSYVYLGDYSGHVTQDVMDAVSLYFNEPDSFAHGYFGFYGDGVRNYFY